MRSFHPHPLLLPALLCALVMLVGRPTEAMGVGDGDELGSGISAQVEQLYEDAALATQQYEAGRQEADVRRAQAEQAQALLDGERQQIARLHEDLGRMARAEYRTGGGLPVAAQLILADSPDALMRSQHILAQANLALAGSVARSRRAEARFAADEAKAKAAWQALEQQNIELAAVKDTIERKLEEARGQLQGQAAASVAAGSCPGSVRLHQPAAKFTKPWVAPVETYVLSAGFGSGGDRWVNRHTGQDFAVPIGTPVRAVGAGRVVSVSCGGAFGIEIVIQHPGGYYTQYAHLAAVAVDQGERVDTGQWIGQSGTTGNSTGPHLHFEVRVTPEMGSAVDPVPWLAARGVRLT
ncbi:peptidoglycan DD-metalloendopeptidase family protein [Streptomyces sp. NPDC002092]